MTTQSSANQFPINILSISNQYFQSIFPIKISINIQSIFPIKISINILSIFFHEKMTEILIVKSTCHTALEPRGKENGTPET